MKARSAQRRWAVTLALVLSGAAPAQPGGGMMGPGTMGPGVMPMPMFVSVESEFQYLSEMIPHHQEAVDAARLLLAGTRRPELRQFAQGIITSQTTEIERVRGWMRDWYPDGRPTPAPPAMLRDLRGLSGDALDRAFLEDMPRHHMAAIMMSQQLVTRNLVRHPGVRPFALNIVATQRNENHQMMRWLFDWFGGTGMPGTGPPR